MNAHPTVDDDLAAELARLRARVAELERASTLALDQAAAHAAGLDSLLANAPVGIALLDTDMRYRHINPYLAHVNGLPREAHLGRTIGEVLPKVAPMVEPIYAQVLASGEALVDVELAGEAYAQPGQSRTWKGTFFPVRAADRSLQGIGVIIVDITAQRQLELALQTEHQQLTAILETLDEGVLAFRPDGALVTLNSAVRRHLGWPANTLLTTIDAFRQASPLRLYDHAGDQIGLEQQPIERALRGESFDDMQVYTLSKDDAHPRWFSFSGATVRDADGQMTLAVLGARDITAEKQADIAIRESRRNLRELIDSTDGAIWSVDTDLKLIVGNAAFQRMAQAIIGRELLHGEPIISAELPAALAAGMRWLYERAFAGKHFSGVTSLPVAGAQRSFEYRVSPMLTATEAIIGATTFARDITEQQRAERALRDTERKLGTLFKLLPVGVSITDAQGAVVYVNPAMEGIMHMGRARLAAGEHTQRPTRRPDGSPFTGADCAGSRALREQRAVMDVEAGFPIDCGQMVWVSASAVPVDFPDWRIVTVTTDITARLSAETALRENAAALSRSNAELTRALRLKDEFLAMMSHELRTPLTAVLGISDALQEELYGPLNPHQQQALGQISTSGRHLLEILSDILDLARIEAGAELLESRFVYIDRLCPTALQIVAERAHKKELQLSQSVTFGVTGLRADERRLTQILVNLLDNAVKFTPAGGTVGLDVVGDATQECITFTVWDSGIGIAAEDMDRLFHPFTQLDGRLARSYDGIGLGLTLVQRLTDLHGGSVQVTSAPGQGSRFSVSLPWSAEDNIRPSQWAPASAPALPIWGRPPHVLVADDHEPTLELYAAQLTRQGCTVLTARTGAEALAQIQAQRPDVVLLDIQMPEINGLSLIRQLRADVTLAGLPIIAVTALVMPGDRERVFAAGATRYLAKPVSNLTLLATIAELLDTTDA